MASSKNLEISITELINSKLDGLVKPIEMLTNNLQAMNEKVDKVLEQVIRTNGRVTELEKSKEEYKPLFFKLKDDVEIIKQQDINCRTNIHKDIRTLNKEVELIHKELLDLELIINNKVTERNDKLKDLEKELRTDIDKLNNRTWLLAKIYEYPKVSAVLFTSLILLIIGIATGYNINTMFKIITK